MSNKKRLLGIVASFVMAISTLGLATPASATTTCLPGTYLSGYDSSICKSTPPGTFTSNANELAPVPCQVGKFQPYYGQSNCLETPVGAANAHTGAVRPDTCSWGTFQANLGAIDCTAAAPGTYVPESGAMAPIPCPAILPANSSANLSRTGNLMVMDCFDFTGDSLVLPKASSTVNDELRFEYYLDAGIAGSDNLKITLVNTTNSNLAYQVKATAYPSDLAGKRATYTIGRNWPIGSLVEGCSVACPGPPIYSIPVGTYNITVEAKARNNTWVNFSANSVQLTDTVTRTPQLYLEAWSHVPLTETANVGVYLVEPTLGGSIKVNISNRPSFLSPTVTRTFSITDGALPERIALPFLGNNLPPAVTSVSGGTITPGLWWVSLTVKDSLNNKDSSNNDVATSEWPYPILVTRACSAGNFSVNGIESCVQTPAGYEINYPSRDSFGSETKAFEPAKCASGTYQPVVGGVACLPAEAGHFAPIAGSVQQLICPIGKYQAESGKSFCLTSDPNYFVSGTGATSQTACPALTFSSAGATSAGDCKPKPCVVAKGSSATSACMLASVAQVLPAKAKVSISMKKSFKKSCKVSGSKVKALAVGTCTVTLTVKPKKGKSSKYTVNVTGS